MRAMIPKEQVEEAALGLWRQSTPHKGGGATFPAYRKGFLDGAGWAESIYRQEVAEEYRELLRAIAKKIATTVDDPEELPEDILERMLESGVCTQAEVNAWSESVG